MSRAHHERSRNQSRTHRPALAAAGWGVVDGSRIRREYPITLGRIEEHKGVRNRFNAKCRIRFLSPLFSVASAVSRLPADVTAQVRIFAPIDIAAPLMSVEAFGSLDPAQQAAFLTGVESAVMPDGLPVSDVVVSTCLLSQLLDSASQIAPRESPDYLPLIQAVRRGHLLRLLSLTVPGGRALLITDLVSSDTVPELAKTVPADLPKLMFQCLQSGNFFSGLNPAVVQHDIQHIPACAEFCASSRILPPWHWHLGPRSFAVYAVAMERCD